jgi:hypothetical protein
MVLVAAPFLMLSETTQRFTPFFYGKISSDPSHVYFVGTGSFLARG